MFIPTVIFIVIAAVAKADIKNGNIAKIKDHPYHASVQVFGAHHCGAVILDKDYLLTSAQCYKPENEFTVRVGSDFKNKGGVVRKIKKFIKHPKFNFINFVPVYDIAVIKLNESLVFGETIKALPLFKPGDKMEAGTEGVVTGYDDVGPNNELQKVTLTIIGKSLCETKYKELGWGDFAETQICANVGKQDVCEGGVGGPMVVNGKVAGIVSWSSSCNEEKYPRVFTEVSVLHDWIKKQIDS